MTTLSKSLIDTLASVCVFIDSSRNWENYDSLGWNDQVVEDLTKWITRLDSKNNIELKQLIYESAASALTSLKTDWTIATVRIMNQLQPLKVDDRRIVKRYIDECIDPGITNLPGVIKAYELLERKLAI